MNRRERLERKIERRLEWAESRDAKSAAAFDAGNMSEEKTGIPFGQPILVGHHSEGRHRRTIERAHRAMERGVEHSHMANHHRSKAEGLQRQLDRCIFSDDDNAIEALEAKLAGLEREREINNTVNKIIRRKPRAEKTPEKIKELIELGVNPLAAEKLFMPDFCGRIGIPAYVNQNLGGRIKQARDRIADLKQRAERAELAERSETGVSITGGEWVSITFAEKPEREILTALKSAGFRWRRGSWNGKRENIPECVEVYA